MLPRSLGMLAKDLLIGGAVLQLDSAVPREAAVVVEAQAAPWDPQQLDSPSAQMQTCRQPSCYLVRACRQPWTSQAHPEFPGSCDLQLADSCDLQLASFQPPRTPFGYLLRALASAQFSAEAAGVPRMPRRGPGAYLLLLRPRARSAHHRLPPSRPPPAPANPRHTHVDCVPTPGALHLPSPPASPHPD